MKGTALTVLKIRISCFATAVARAAPAPHVSLWICLNNLLNTLKHRSESCSETSNFCNGPTQSHCNGKTHSLGAGLRLQAAGERQQLPGTLRWAALFGRIGKLSELPLSKPAIPTISDANQRHLSLQDFPEKQRMLHVHTLFKSGATEAGAKWNSRSSKPLPSTHHLLFLSPASSLPNTFVCMANLKCARGELVRGRQVKGTKKGIVWNFPDML
jgi:hypothetical protein